MDKFGLFDMLNKLQINEKQSTAFQKILTSLLTSNGQKNTEKEKGESPKTTEPPPYFKSDAILSVIKKHDLISKQIDKDNNKN